MRCGIYVAPVVVGFWCGQVAAEPIVFGDAGVELLVRAAINQADGEIDDQDPRLADVLMIETGPLLIDDLTGIEFLVNLEVLSLPGNLVTDVSPLSGLVALRELNLARNMVSDLTPIAGLTDLQVLDLTENLIVSVAPLGDLRNLVELRLGVNMIGQITALGSLAGPDVLELQDNAIRDAGPLLEVDAFPDGAVIDLRGNPLSTDSLCSVVLPLQREGVTVLADGECPGVIVGSIRDELTNAAIACALVLAEPPVGPAAIGPTSLEGSYQLDGLPPGTSTLRIFAPGYQPEIGQGSVSSSSQRRISFQLARRTSQGFLEVAGVIRDDLSEATLAGVQIEARSGQQRLGETYSCADGRYELLLDPNTVDATIQFDAPGYEPQMFDIADGLPGNVSLTPLSMRAGSVEGRVFDGRERTVSGLGNARVTLKIEGGAVAYSVRTNDRGEYTVTNLPSGVYTARASASQITDEFAQRSIEILGAEEGLDFTLGKFVEPEPGGCPADSLVTPVRGPSKDGIVLALLVGILAIGATRMGFKPMSR